MKELEDPYFDGEALDGRFPGSLGPHAALRHARMRAATPYLQRWRPWTLSLALTATIFLTLAYPSDSPRGVVAAFALAATTSWAAAWASRMGADITRTALVLTTLDIPLIAYWSIASTSSTGEILSALVGLVLIAAWLFGPRVTASIAAASVTAILLVWFAHDRWSHPQPLPDVVWVVGLAGVLGFVISAEVERTWLDTTRTMQRTAEQLHELAAMRRRLVADVSHELRTPLTAVNGFLDTVLRDDIDLSSAHARELLSEARRGGERLESLVADLLDVEHASSGHVPLTFAVLDLRTLLEAAIRTVPAPPARHVQLELVPELDGHTMRVDEHRFVRVVGHLVRNAIEHGAGDVTVACESREGGVLIDVYDQGPGLPPGSEQHAFEPFATFGDHLGSPGLGLAIARAFVGVHGGSLEYVTDERGHAFRVLLPDSPRLSES